MHGFLLANTAPLHRMFFGRGWRFLAKAWFVKICKLWPLIELFASQEFLSEYLAARIAHPQEQLYSFRDIIFLNRPSLT